MYRSFCRIFILLVFPIACYAQRDSLHEVRGLPTKQVYDLMFDSKGFLWIGHEFGLSRYDGNHFTHFHCPQQNSLAVSNIMEDAAGRIWCRNFTSQVFYIEKNEMKLLAQFQYKEEPRFPSMVIINNRLICNSKKGIFVLDLKDFSSKIIKCGKKAITSLAVCRNKVIAYSQGDLRFFFYDPESPDSLAREIPIDQNINQLDDFVLQTNTDNDTIYSFSSRTSSITRLTYSGGMMHVLGYLKGLGFMNTINRATSHLWLHTSLVSYQLGGNEIIKGHNLSDLVRDKEGNTWMSSLTEGLLVKYNRYWQLLKLDFINKNEVILRVDDLDHFSVYATDLNNIYVSDKRTHKIHSVKLSPENGPVQFLKILKSRRVIISTKLQVYLLNLDDLKLVTPLKNYYFFSAKCAVEVDSSIYAATASGLFKLIHAPDIYGNDFSASVIYPMRARWIEYNDVSKRLFIAFKDGIMEYKNNKLIPVSYHKEDIAAVCMLAVKDKTFISSFSSDLFVIQDTGVKKLELQKESGPVFKMIARNDSVWMLGADYINVINAANLSVKKIQVPRFPDAAIYDMVFLEDKISLLTSRGAYTINFLTQDNLELVNYITNIAVNGKVSDIQDGARLKPFENNIEIELAAPFYTNSENLYFRYRLKRKNDEPWINGEYGQNKFLFSSLQKGSYTFEAMAIHSQFGDSGKQVSFSFTIKPVWFETLWVKFLFSLLLASAIVLPLTMYFRYRLKYQRAAYEKQLAVQHERDRISEEIHDDIGAGLSGVRLLTEMTGKKISDPQMKGAMQKIYSSVSELSSKMQDVIWSLNTRNDSLENLLLHIQKQAGKLFSNSDIRAEIILPQQVPDILLHSDTRSDIYLAVKEALHNVLKHSGADEVKVAFSFEKNILKIIIADNGRGLTGNELHGNGMLNMKKRVSRLNGTMRVESGKGLTVEFELPLRVQGKPNVYKI